MKFDPINQYWQLRCGFLGARQLHYRSDQQQPGLQPPGSVIAVAGGPRCEQGLTPLSAALFMTREQYE